MELEDMAFPLARKCYYILVNISVTKKLAEDRLFKVADSPALSNSIQVDLLLKLLLMIMHIFLQQGGESEVVNPAHGERCLNLQVAACLQ